MAGFQVELVFVALAMWRQGDVSVEAGGDRGGEDVLEVEGRRRWPRNRFGSLVDPPIWKRARRANYCALRPLRAARLGPSARKSADLRMTIFRLENDPDAILGTLQAWM
jgi:hypothetical protein